MTARQEITQLLDRWRGGDRKALDELVRVVGPELRQIARRSMQQEHPGHTLQTTAVVHEAYLRLVDGVDVAWTGREHFLAVASTIMRRILVEHARAKQAAKRGGDAAKITLDDAVAVSPHCAPEILDVDRALEQLAAFDEQGARIVEMKFFGGMSIDEIASVLAVHPNTVMRRWSAARAWLYTALRDAS